jgi:hypothetical protein
MGVPLIAETHFSASFAGDACHRCGARPSIEIIKERHEFWGEKRRRKLSSVFPVSPKSCLRSRHPIYSNFPIS